MEDFQRDVNPATTTLFKEDKADQEVQVVESQDQHRAEDADQDDETEGNEGSVLDQVRANPHLELLPENSHKRRFPVKCNLCFRKHSRAHAIFDLVNLKKAKMLRQHLKTHTHRAKLAEWQANQVPVDLTAGASGTPGFVPCEGLSLPHCEGSKLYEMQNAYKLWAACNSSRGIQSAWKDKQEEFGHTYTYDIRTDSHAIRHQSCATTSSTVFSEVPPSVCQMQLALERQKCTPHGCSLLLETCSNACLAQACWDGDGILVTEV